MTKKIYEYTVSWKTHIWCLLISFIMIIGLNGIISDKLFGLYMIINDCNINIISNHPMIWFYIAYFILMFILVSIHELTHGLAHKILGGKPIYGFKHLFPYCAESSGIIYSTYKFFIVLLLPLVLISVLFLINNPIVQLLAFMNLIGASGDIFMTLLLIRYRKNKVKDSDKGFEVLE